MNSDQRAIIAWLFFIVRCVQQSWTLAGVNRVFCKLLMQE